MKEREISLLELLIEIMLRWRVIFIWMAVGAVLAGAFSYVRSNHALQAVQSGDQALEPGQQLLEDLSALEEQLTDVQLQNVNYVIAYESIYRNKLAYKEKSLLMQIDPNCVQRIDLTFYVDADNWRRAGDIEKAYEDIVQTDELGTYAAGQISEKDTGSMSELITLARGSGSILEGTNTFRVRLIHYDRTVLRDMAEAVVRFVQNKHGQIEETMGTHEIVLLNQSDAVVADMSILDRQKSIIDEIASTKTVILQYKDAFTSDQQQYYDLIAGAGSDTDEAEAKLQESAGSVNTSLGISIKYVVLGMFLAVFLYVFIFFMRYIANTKLCASDSLQELYGIPQIAMIPQQERKKLFAFIDRWILMLRDRRSFTRDEAMSLSAAAVKMAAAREGTGKICMIGSGLSGQALEACETIRDSLAAEGINAEILSNVLYDAQAMCSLERVSAAVLVECVQSSFYSEIAREIELLRQQEITVLGGIVVG